MGLPDDGLMQKRWTYLLDVTVLQCRNAQLCTMEAWMYLRNILKFTEVFWSL